MNGRAFLDVAGELVRSVSEAHWRTATGRAYYGLLLECRDALERWGFKTPPRDQVHAYVRLRFIYCPDADMQEIGQRLEELGKLRNRADYQLGPHRDFASPAVANLAVQKARQALSWLDQAAADLPRRSAIIAGIRAAFP